MKLLQLLFLAFMISIFITPKLAAQDGFPSILIYNRVLLLNYTDNADPDMKNELLKLFDGMRSRIDGCEWSHISDLMKSSQGFDQVVTLTFKSEASLEAYDSHPDYIRFKELSVAILEGFEFYEYKDILE